MKPEYLKRFDAAIGAARAEYLGPETDIGGFIYSQPGSNDPTRLAEIAENCLYRIRRGISIKTTTTEAHL